MEENPRNSFTIRCKNENADTRIIIEEIPEIPADPAVNFIRGKKKMNTRAKARAKRLSTIINSLHDLTTRSGDAQAYSPSEPSEDNESDRQGDNGNILEPSIQLTIQVKDEPASDYSSDGPGRDGTGAASSESSKVSARDLRRKRGRPKKDSVAAASAAPPADPGQKRKQVRYKDHPCEVCGKLFDSYYLKVHMRRHTGEKPFGCGSCGRAFCKKSQLKAHFQRHHGECGARGGGPAPPQPPRTGSIGRFECKVCGKVFRQMSNLSQHEKTHLEGKQYKCDLCVAEFKAKASFEKHKEEVHEGIKRVFACHLCDKSFTRKAKLNDHVNFHLGQSRHLCEYCGKPFLSRKTLRTHLLIHEDKKPYLCQVCGRSFRQSNVLKLHMTTHTGIKPYKCQLCCKQFIHRVYLVRHNCPSKPASAPALGGGPQQGVINLSNKPEEA